MSADNVFVEKTITAENQWTDPIRLRGNFMLTIAATAFTANITVQRRYDSGAAWQTVTKDDAGTAKTITGVGQFVGFEGSDRGAEYRAGVATGGFTSSTALVVRLEQ